MNDQDLHVVNSHKHLGVIISDNGQWNDHIDYIVKKTYNRLNIMRKSRTFLDRYSLEKIYISFIRPLMEYADVIWFLVLIRDLNEFSDSKLRVGSGKSFHAFTVEGRKYSE
jgi:hypothetical protein